jgi:hypothetical protein
VDALMRISFRTESDATRGITAKQSILTHGFSSNECCDVGLSELEAMFVLAGPLLFNSQSAYLLSCDQHHAEARFALHHATVRISSLLERKCLDHGSDIL